MNITATSNNVDVTYSDDTEVIRQSLLNAHQVYSSVLALPALLPKLNASSQSLSQNRESSIAARKHLTELTKKFKRLVKAAETGTGNPVDLAREGKTCVKAYQEEIDALTKRCKACDGAFNNVHSILQSIPDPSTAVIEPALSGLEQLAKELQMERERSTELESKLKSTQQELDKANNERTELSKKVTAAQSAPSSASSLKNAEKEELIQLRKEVSEYELEFRSLKNQDITIRKLEAQITEMKESQEDNINEAISKVERDLAEKASLRVADALEREAAMERKLNALEVELQTERAGRIATQDQMMEREDGYWSQREAAWEAQRGILSGEAERLREELGLIRKERDELMLRVEVFESSLAANKDGSSSSPSAPTSGNVRELAMQQKAYEAEVAELNATNFSLREEMRTIEDAMTAEKEELKNQLEEQLMKCSELEGNVHSLRTQLANIPSAEEIEKMQRELRVLKRLEFNADHEGDMETGVDPEMTTVPIEKDLETVLVTRLRKMEADLVRERNLKSEMEQEQKQIQARVLELEKANANSEQLIKSLEHDLETAVASAQALKPKRDSTSSRSILPNPSPDPNTLQQILDPSESPAVPSSKDRSTMTDTSVKSSLESKPKDEREEDNHSVVTIVMAQRDRLRARCDALEAEKDSFKQELQVQVRLSESLKTDNTKLYEKVRYLQNYRTSNSAAVAMGDADIDMEALEERYEASVDPFRQFSRAERQRKLKEMNPMDRLVFMGARTLLSTKQTRTALFCYIIGMHLLVFFTTHSWSSDHGCHEILSEHPDFSHLHHGVPKLDPSDNLTSGTS